MKKLLITMLSVILANSAHAGDVAKLSLKITGAVNNTYFLCVSDQGCFSLYAASKGKTFSIEPGTIASLFMTNTSNLNMYTQALPSSCKINVAQNKTLTISGKLVVKNSAVYLNKLHCSAA